MHKTTAKIYLPDGLYILLYQQPLKFKYSPGLLNHPKNKLTIGSFDNWWNRVGKRMSKYIALKLCSEG
ncbi:hypothetical protein Mucpa_1828 [Mucilaginibacter paludis DSM 18603]|uniref:Uncharacterized protein n=1 Tax=Mucilaginibacter paludis DSM 18603 TaxID=714943 RepID=H1YAA0_9SPHI|nr:hypothetical protein Mucpa_1828 [Mucilaginibacter paludis DSM 18603]